MKILVADACSVILLARAGLMNILLREFKVVIPERVYQECVNPETLKRFPDALAIQQWVQDKKIVVKKVDVQKIEKIEYLYQIGQGEKEAIALSLDDKESLLLTDDGGAIKIAKYLQKSFIISPVIAVDLYQLGFISFDEAKRAIEKLNTIGRYLPNLIADVFIMLESVRTDKEKERK